MSSKKNCAACQANTERYPRVLSCKGVIVLVKTTSCEDHFVPPKCRAYKSCRGEPPCFTHKCKAWSCRLPMASESMYCTYHKCHGVEANTDEPCYSEGFRYGSRTCIFHKCEIYDCLRLKEFSSSYCTNHICDMDGCKLKREYGQYCYIHQQ